MATDEKEAAIERNPGACPIVHSVYAVGEQYRLLVVYNLLDGERRFNDLKRAMGASSRTLSQALDALQEEGVVRRRSAEGDPIAVYYGLTEKGKALESVFGELAAWDEQFGDTGESGGPEETADATLPAGD
jgi:DNA-binding HxlR family transcriptional regulator